MLMSGWRLGSGSTTVRAHRALKKLVAQGFDQFGIHSQSVLLFQYKNKKRATSGLQRVRLGQEVPDPLGKAGRVFNLGPVAAAPEHMELRAVNPLRQRQRVGQRNHLVFTAVQYQGLVRQRALTSW